MNPITRPCSGITLLVAILCAGACSDVPPEWHEESGYRWRELSGSRRGGPGFTQLDSSRTGIGFANFATQAQLMQNRHLAQGSGVTLGDVDGDGLVDIYLGRTEGAGALYKNLGNWRFEEISERAGVTAEAGSGYWSQNGATQVLGIAGVVTGLWVRWPDGTETEVPVETGQLEVVLRL